MNRRILRKCSRNGCSCACANSRYQAVFSSPTWPVNEARGRKRRSETERGKWGEWREAEGEVKKEKEVVKGRGEKERGGRLYNVSLCMCTVFISC